MDENSFLNFLKDRKASSKYDQCRIIGLTNKNIKGNFFIGQFEKMFEDMSFLFSKYFKINDIEITNHIHKPLNYGLNYVDFYNQEGIDLVEKMCKEDIDFFEYDFNGIAKKNFGFFEVR